MADCKTAMSGSTAMVGTLSKMSTMAVGCCIDSTATGRGLGMDSMTDSGEGMNQATKEPATNPPKERFFYEVRERDPICRNSFCLERDRAVLCEIGRVWQGIRGYFRGGHSNQACDSLGRKPPKANRIDHDRMYLSIYGGRVRESMLDRTDLRTSDGVKDGE